MFCDQCGKKIDDGARFCIHCGNKVDAGAAADVPMTSNDWLEQPLHRSSLFRSLFRSLCSGPLRLFPLYASRKNPAKRAFSV